MSVPVTTQCTFQVDVSVAARPGAPFYFYSGTRASVPGCGLTSSIAGDIYLCASGGIQTATEVPAGTLAAAGPQVVVPRANPLPPTKIPSGSYSMIATAPHGYVLVGCGGAAVVGATGTTATESMTIPVAANAFGAFYAVPVSTASGGSGPPTGPAAQPGGPAPTTPANPTQALTESVQPETVTPVAGPALAFTGVNSVRLLLLGGSSGGLGSVMIAISRRRRLTSPGGSASRRPHAVP